VALAIFCADPQKGPQRRETVIVSDFSAIRPGTDLLKYARELLRMHDAIIGGSRSPMRPRDLVARSWTRVLELGLDPDGMSTCDPLGMDEVERRRRESPLNGVIDELKQVVSSVADASHFLMVVTDADGVLLWREGSSSVRRRADILGFSEGALWTEAMVGTNAIGTALADAAPVQLFSAEHFEQNQHPWYCTASPIHDPRTGELLGIVDVSGPALTLHPAISALVETAARLAESQLWRHHEDRLERLRRAAAPLLATVGGPMLLVDENGWVAHNSGIAVRERIAAPRADRALAVPGLGLCLPQPLGDGWLVRPSGTDPTVSAELNLTHAPTLEVCAGGEPWRSSLTTRHTEILLLLHAAGPAGLNAEQLSCGLFGDTAHVVTIRAEVSRLRRAFGALVETQPYRVASGVLMTLVLGPSDDVAECAFVCSSSSPGVRSLAAASRVH
jgi:GAF domain